MLRIYDGNGAPPAVRIAGVMQLREGKLIARRDYYDPASYRARGRIGRDRYGKVPAETLQRVCIRLTRN